MEEIIELKNKIKKKLENTNDEKTKESLKQWLAYLEWAEQDIREEIKDCVKYTEKTFIFMYWIKL